MFFFLYCIYFCLYSFFEGVCDLLSYRTVLFILCIKFSVLRSFIISYISFSFGYIFDDDLIEFLEKTKKVIRIYDKSKSKKTINIKKYNNIDKEHPNSGLLFVKENISSDERFI